MSKTTQWIFRCASGSRAKLLPYTNFYVEVLTQFWIKLLHVEVLTKVWIKLLHVEVLTIFPDKTSTLTKSIKKITAPPTPRLYSPHQSIIKMKVAPLFNLKSMVIMVRMVIMAIMVRMVNMVITFFIQGVTNTYISNKYQNGFMAGVSYRSVLFLIKFLFIVEIVLFVCSCMLVRARSSFVMQEPWDRMGFQKSRQSWSSWPRWSSRQPWSMWS